MKKVAIACAIFFLSFHATAQTYLNCDFSDGIPTDFTLIDNDGLTPSVDMQKMGFEVGKPWIALNPNGETNLAACSTSWYSPSGQSDDWMITPNFTIDTDKAVLTWRAKASDKKYRDGYAVYISTTGGKTIADFDKANPLFTVDQEESSWTDHSVDISAYKGKTVSLAFVNNSTNKSRLFIDDIYAGEHSKVYCTLDLGSGTPDYGDITISGKAFTKEKTAVTGYTIGLEYGGNTYTQDFTSTLNPGETLPFTLDKKLPVGNHETVPYSVWIKSGDDKYVLSTNITSYPRKVVAEELTGTWCAWCVRGIVSLAKIKANDSKWFIGVAAHQGDVMTSDYTSGAAAFCSSDGLPTGVINRKYKCDPKDFESTGLNAFEKEPVLVAMNLEAKLDMNTKVVTSDTKLWFNKANSAANYRLAYAIIENDVHKAGDKKYNQNNAAYCDNQHGEMGGYEKRPSIIVSDSMYFQEVARYYDVDFNGIEGSVPSVVNADETIDYPHSFTLPDNILDYNNTELIVLLIDQSDDHIVNAINLPLGTSDGIDNHTSTEIKEVARYNINGMRLTSPTKGINIVKLTNGKTVKVMVR
jgi:hypothetical protein